MSHLASVSIIIGMLKAILWDNDGVLVDTEQLFFAITTQTFAQVGKILTQKEWARHYLGQGMPSRDIALLKGVSPDQVDAFIERRNHAFRDALATPLPLRPGIKETLDQLRDRIRLGLVTSATRRHFELVHKTTGLIPFFEVVVTYDDCPHIKPAPDAYQMAVRELRLTPQECLAVEDSPRGLQAARAAGLECILFPTDLTDLSACNGTRVVHNAKDILPILQSDYNLSID